MQSTEYRGYLIVEHPETLDQDEKALTVFWRGLPMRMVRFEATDNRAVFHDDKPVSNTLNKALRIHVYGNDAEHDELPTEIQRETIEEFKAFMEKVRNQ